MASSRWKQGAPYGTSAIPYIGKNGNWWVNQEDTGVKAQGPEGKQGPRGEAGIGAPGPALIYEDLTEEQKQELSSHYTPEMLAIKDDTIAEATALKEQTITEVEALKEATVEESRAVASEVTTEIVDKAVADAQAQMDAAVAENAANLTAAVTNAESAMARAETAANSADAALTSMQNIKEDTIKTASNTAATTANDVVNKMVGDAEARIGTELDEAVNNATVAATNAESAMARAETAANTATTAVTDVTTLKNVATAASNDALRHANTASAATQTAEEAANRAEEAADRAEASVPEDYSALDAHIKEVETVAQSAQTTLGYTLSTDLITKPYIQSVFASKDVYDMTSDGVTFGSIDATEAGKFKINISTAQPDRTVKISVTRLTLNAGVYTFKGNFAETAGVKMQLLYAKDGAEICTIDRTTPSQKLTIVAATGVLLYLNIDCSAVMDATATVHLTDSNHEDVATRVNLLEASCTNLIDTVGYTLNKELVDYPYCGKFNTAHSIRNLSTYGKCYQANGAFFIEVDSPSTSAYATVVIKELTLAAGTYTLSSELISVVSSAPDAISVQLYTGESYKVSIEESVQFTVSVTTRAILSISVNCAILHSIVIKPSLIKGGLEGMSVHDILTGCLKRYSGSTAVNDIAVSEEQGFATPVIPIPVGYKPLFIYVRTVSVNAIISYNRVDTGSNTFFLAITVRNVSDAPLTCSVYYECFFVREGICEDL